MLHLTINGKPVEVPEGSTIMEAAEAAGVKVPSLCHMKNVHQYGSCRICVVEVEMCIRDRIGTAAETAAAETAATRSSGERAAFAAASGESSGAKPGRRPAR